MRHLQPEAAPTTQQSSPLVPELSVLRTGYGVELYLVLKLKSQQT